MICTMCPTLRLSDTHAPGHGWRCPCGAIHCSHMYHCLDCGLSRYALERDERIHGKQARVKKSR